jgi:hypothetical protein
MQKHARSFENKDLVFPGVIVKRRVSARLDLDHSHREIGCAVTVRDKPADTDSRSMFFSRRIRRYILVMNDLHLDPSFLTKPKVRNDSCHSLGKLGTDEHLTLMQALSETIIADYVKAAEPSISC